MSVPVAVRRYLAELGRKGGQAGRGASKRRTREQARAAARVRWDRVKHQQKDS